MRACVTSPCCSANARRNMTVRTSERTRARWRMCECEEVNLGTHVCVWPCKVHCFAPRSRSRCADKWYTVHAQSSRPATKSCGGAAAVAGGTCLGRDSQASGLGSDRRRRENRRPARLPAPSATRCEFMTRSFGLPDDVYTIFIVRLSWGIAPKWTAQAAQARLSKKDKNAMDTVQESCSGQRQPI
eukprot:4044862-Pleurochrysis_carterae.AAC.2